jgi:hypothetical protein
MSLFLTGKGTPFYFHWRACTFGYNIKEFYFRGRESAEITSPIQKKLDLKGMGLTVPTHPRGLEAEAIIVDSLEELRINKYNVRKSIPINN